MTSSDNMATRQDCGGNQHTVCGGLAERVARIMAATDLRHPRSAWSAPTKRRYEALAQTALDASHHTELVEALRKAVLGATLLHLTPDAREFLGLEEAGRILAKVRCEQVQA